MSESRRTVGIFHPPEAKRDSGLTIICNEFMEAMMDHGQHSELEVFMEPRTELMARMRGRCSTRGVFEAEDRARDGAIHVWHDLVHDMSRVITVRQRSERAPYPLTFAVHNGHPNRHLSTIVLPLLLGPTHPCDALVCPSRSLAGVFDRLFAHMAASSLGPSPSYRGRVEVIPWGLDTETFKPRDRAEHRRRFGLPIEATILLYVGRVSPVQKGDLLPLLRVLAELAPTTPELLLVIAGRVEVAGYEELIRSYAAHLGITDRIRFLGHVRPDERHLVYNCGDVFVAPTDWIDEGFGLTPLEAMASGIPQVVSDWDGYRDTVEHDRTGILVPTLWADCSSDVPIAMTKDVLRDMRAGQSIVIDLRALGAALAGLVHNADLRGRMAEESRRRATSCFGWPTIVAAYESLWAELEDASRGLDADRRPSPYDPPLFGTVGHYASRVLSDDDALALTSAGRDLLEGREVLPFSGRFEIHDEELLAELLGALEAGPRTVAVLAQTHGPRGRVLRHLLWLMKFGFVTAGEA
ncbi:glycosyltransferase family 4 protein [Paraliomyxa miuraensis]|uniref:glycosyltransferase family 4 protein n=1 Tax=Paraliomyxa miuraensis TaxID=376150 RepID=UPI002255CE63|nr:glycosyltransferase family 4 protein [Paraliomyxa miuraensis]MCX4241589.1 glycosyltransferase family 4 protein [Paraliomyxa miuraensis]